MLSIAAINALAASQGKSANLVTATTLSTTGGGTFQGGMHVDLAISYKPRLIIVSDLIKERLARVERLFTERAARSGVRIMTFDPQETDLKQTVDELSGLKGADDVIVAVGSQQAISAGQSLLGKGGVLNLFGGLKKGQDMVPFDTSAIHYKGDWASQFKKDATKETPFHLAAGRPGDVAARRRPGSAGPCGASPSGSASRARPPAGAGPPAGRRRR